MHLLSLDRRYRTPRRVRFRPVLRAAVLVGVWFCAATGCVLPELVIDDGAGSSGGSGGSDDGSGGEEPSSGGDGNSDGSGGDAPGTGGDEPGGGGAPTGGAPGTGGEEPGTGGATGGEPGSGGDGSGGQAPTYGGYIVQGDWHGYMFTAGVDGTEIDPANYRDATGFPFCAAGTIPGTEEFTGQARIGWNLNQGSMCVGATCPDPGTVIPTSAGVRVEYSATDIELPVRLVAVSADDPPIEWCYGLATPGIETFVSWESLNTECWDNAGTFYNGEPLATLTLLVPGDGIGQVRSFDYCLESIAEQFD